MLAHAHRPPAGYCHTRICLHFKVHARHAYERSGRCPGSSGCRGRRRAFGCTKRRHPLPLGGQQGRPSRLGARRLHRTATADRRTLWGTPARSRRSSSAIRSARRRIEAGTTRFSGSRERKPRRSHLSGSGHSGWTALARSVHRCGTSSRPGRDLRSSICPKRDAGASRSAGQAGRTHSTSLTAPGTGPS